MAKIVNRMSFGWLALGLVLTGGLGGDSSTRGADDLGLLEQRAFRAATETIADCVVQIRTVGGLNQIDGQVLAQGPTTALIVTDDGYIVSSAINFAQRPTSILVRLPGGAQRPAELVGRDANRQLVLLKVKADEPLPTPTAAPLSELRVGDWSIAVGRTFAADEVNVSVGIVSALGRMQGRAVQTDANASSANYGGPLVDLHGRVIGVLVPMSPQSAGPGDVDETAGVEYYDSGIAFAVPMEHVLSVLNRWIEEGDLKRGLLGVGMTDGNPHTTEPRVTAVWPGSPASIAKWKPDDLIVSVDGKQVATQMQLRFALSPMYAGDSLAIVVSRGRGDDAERLETRVTLAAELPPYRHAFLGVLPDRATAPADDATDEVAAAERDPGIAVRSVWPDSPAADAGLQPGDVITRLGDEKIASLRDAYDALGSHHPGDELAIQVQRDQEEVEINATLIDIPEELPESDADAESDLDASPEGDALKLEEFKLPEMPQTARYFAPETGGSAPGLLIWLASGDPDADAEFAAPWIDACRRTGLVLLLASPADAKGWSSDDREYLARLIPAAIRRFGADERRVVIGGEGKAGQLAYAIGFQGRRWIRGIAVIDSPLPRTLELPPNGPGEPLAVLSIETRNGALAPLIQQDLAKIRETGRPATKVTRRAPSAGGAALDAPSVTTLARWVEALDRF